MAPGYVVLACLLAGPWAVQGFSCVNRPDGIYDESCQTFIKCENNVTTEVECHKPLVVNPETSKCDNALNVNTPCGLFRDCSFRDDGNYPEMDHGCHWYFTCHYGIFYGHSKCPGGLVLNTMVQTCDFPFNVLPPCGTKTT